MKNIIEKMRELIRQRKERQQKPHSTSYSDDARLQYWNGKKLDSFELRLLLCSPDRITVDDQEKLISLDSNRAFIDDLFGAIPGRCEIRIRNWSKFQIGLVDGEQLENPFENGRDPMFPELGVGFSEITWGQIDIFMASKDRSLFFIAPGMKLDKPVVPGTDDKNVTDFAVQFKFMDCDWEAWFRADE